MVTQVACFMLYISAFAYPHPGGMHPQAQINFVKQQLKLQKEPFTAAYKQLIARADSALQAQHHAMADLSIPGFYFKPDEHRRNKLGIQTDSFLAYSCALAWQLSGNTVYADKALYFLNAWGQINKQYSEADGPLVLSYTGGAMVMAAELMYNYNKWNNASRNEFAGWVKNVYRKAANEIRIRPNNWGDWGRFGSALADYYLDDEADMARNIRLIKGDLFEKIAADGHLTEEVKREANGIWYTYFSLSPITGSCWVVYNATGQNLFQLQKDGCDIKKAIDYLLYYEQHAAEWPWFKNPRTGQTDKQNGPWPANLIEAMYGIYHDEKYNVFAASQRPVMYDKHHFVWTFTTLMPVSLNYPQ